MKFVDKKVIIFDFDGTLIDSEPDLALALNYMLDKLNRETYTQSVISHWVGNGAETLVKRALSGSTIIDEHIEQELFLNALDIFLKFYAQNLCVKTYLYPNVKKSLEKLKEQGYIMVIVTNKPADFVEPILKGLAIDEFFEFYLGGDSLEKRKPDPMPLLHVCNRLDITVDECVMIGDSKNDILSAKSAKMQSIGVSYGYNYGEDISIYKPTIVVESFADILPIFF
ncbi:MAG TPA: phosphoglycolate phosphatase [Campylobacterales bacterium]|nr:phosphoglycolate phosphatase [Campylobacterales bacterium]